MATNRDVIRTEQQAVDYAYDCLDKWLSERSRQRTPSWDVTDAKAGTTFIPETPPELLAEDDDLGGAALVIKRVDVADDKFTESQTFYIGRRVVRTPEGDLAVISWHARAAKEWMLARSDDPGDVLLRRDLRCDGRKVTGYFDDIKAPRHTDVGADIPGEAEEPQWLDLEDFLLEDLRRARGGQMRDIVETIQREQFILVSDERKSLLVVQGGPGTGKTAVGLHRVSWLLFNDVVKASDVLVVGPHQGFLKYVGQVLPQLGTRGVTSIELARLWDGEARGSDNLEARRIKSSSKMAEVLRRAVDNLANPKALESAAARTIQVGPRPVTLPPSFIRFTGTEGVRLPYLVRRRQFTDRVVDHLLRAGGAAGKRSRDEPGARKQVEQRRDVIRMVSRVFPSVSAEELLRSLLRGRQALRAAAAGVLSEEEQQAIVRTPAAKVSQEVWSPEDLVCLEEIRFLMTGETSVRWQHVVVDEAQDLTPMQARSLARRCPSGSMTLLGDLAQATGVHRYAGWQELAGQLGGQSGGHLAELTIGYRVPREVMDFAAPLAAVLAPDTTFPRSVRPPADDEVLRIIRTDPSRLVAEAIERVSTLSGTDGKRGRSVAFILPDDDPGMLRSAQAGIAAEQLESVIQVRTAGQIKGLEFDHVVVLEPAAIAAQEWAGLHGLYVAITRCTQTLTIVHSDPLPTVLTGMSEESRETSDQEPGDNTGDAPSSTELPAQDIAFTEPPTDDPARTASTDSFRARLLAEVADERTSSVHEYLRYTLIGELFRVGRTPQVDSPLIDTACDDSSGWMLFEVLGEDGNTYPRMREGAIRLTDIEFAEGRTAEHRFLVLPEQPERGAIDAIAERHGTHIIWPEGQGWGGTGFARAFGGNQR